MCEPIYDYSDMPGNPDEEIDRLQVMLARSRREIQDLKEASALEHKRLRETEAQMDQLRGCLEACGVGSDGLQEIVDDLRAEVQNLQSFMRQIAGDANRLRMTAEEGLGLDKPFKALESE